MVLAPKHPVLYPVNGAGRKQEMNDEMKQIGRNLLLLGLAVASTGAAVGVVYLMTLVVASLK